MPRLLSILCLCACLLLCVYPLGAQWQADLSGYNIPSHERGWQGNSSHYYIHAGYLSLNGKESGGTSYLRRSLRLEAECRWRGRVRLDQGVSTQSRAYVLLSSTGRSGSSVTYLALRVDAGLGASTSLVIIDVDEAETARIVHEQSLHTTTLRAAHTWRELSYDLSLHSAGQMQIHLNDHYEQEVGRYRESIQWAGQIQGLQTFGVLCLYDGGSRQGIHFADLRVDAIEAGTLPTPPQEDEEEKHRPLLLSELMSYPEEGGAQYIEIYNPNTVSISLKGYSIGIGKDEAHLEYSYLDMLEYVPAQSYVVLSNDTPTLTQTYPRLPWGRERQIDLARMPVHSGSIRLYRRGTLVDKLDYNPELHHAQLKQRRGVALECSNIEEVATSSAPARWQSARSRDGYASPGYAASEHPTSMQEASKGNLYQLEDIIRQAEKDNGASLSTSIYTMAGETLIRMVHTDALDFLKSLRDSPQSTLARIPTVYQGVAVLSVVVHSRIPKRYSLKFIIR